MSREIVDIFDISYEGAGVGKIDGQVVFVPKALPGEQVEIEIVRRGSNFMIGEVCQVLKPSEYRVEPECPYYDFCGGCCFQHCDEDAEEQLKIQILKDEIKKAGYVGEVDFVDSDKRLGYRNKIKLDVQNDKLGFYRQKSREFVEIDQCLLADEEMNEALADAREFLRNNKFRFAKSVYVKRVEDDIAIVFLFAKEDPQSQKNFKNIDILQKYAVYFAFGEYLESNDTKLMGINAYRKLEYNYHDHKLQVNVAGFNQVNNYVADRLYEYVVELTQNKRVVNAYSGQGFLTYLISNNAKFVYGIEYQLAAHKMAEKVKEWNENYKITNICGKVEDVLPQVMLRDRIDTIVLDPARDGCHKNVLDTIKKNDIREIIYISCDFATLTRDLGVLGDNYEIVEVTVFNMFPCTANMETVAILHRKS